MALPVFIRLRRINWRWPLRLWFRSGAEFWEWIAWLGVILSLAFAGFCILHWPPGG